MGKVQKQICQSVSVSLPDAWLTLSDLRELVAVTYDLEGSSVVTAGRVSEGRAERIDILEVGVTTSW